MTSNMAVDRREPASWSSPGESSADTRLISAALVLGEGDGECVYAMYDARALSSAGVFLAGPLLLEKGEELLLELMLDAGTRVRVKGHVVSSTRGQPAGVTVRFSGVGEKERELLDAYAGEAGKE